MKTINPGLLKSSIAMLEAIKMAAAIKSGFRVDGMTISFDVMMQELSYKLSAKKKK
jgi:hypothetical protein